MRLHTELAAEDPTLSGLQDKPQNAKSWTLVSKPIGDWMSTSLSLTALEPGRPSFELYLS